MSFRRNIINRRVIRDLKKRSTFGVIFYVIVVFMVFFTNGFYKRHPDFAMIFLFLINTICVFRFIHLLVSSRISKQYETLNNWIFITCVSLTSLSWGLMYGFFMIQKGEYDAKLLMAICTVGLCAGGTIAFMPYYFLSLFFNVSILIPPAIMMLFYQANPLLIVSNVLFSVYLALIGFKGSNEYWEALENEFLLEKKSDDLKKLSRTDVLTGLFNRRYFDEVFDYEWKRAIRNNTAICIMICDIDHFKKVNDTYGHLAGDEFLKITAGILNKILKRKTDIVARYGGEEFVVLVTGMNPDKAFELAERLRLEIENCSLDYKETIIKTTMSIGISNLTPCCHDTKDKLIYDADSALYDAKNEGRNRVKM